MSYKAEHLRLHGDAITIVVHSPSMCGHFVLDYKLHGSVVTFETVPCSHDKSITSRAKFFAQLISMHEVKKQMMSRWKTLGIGTTEGCRDKV